MNNDLHPDDRHPPFPTTASRLLSERYTLPNADTMEAIEEAIRNAPPNTAVEVPPGYIEAITAANRHPLLAERETTHGNFSATALIAQRFKEVARNTPNWQSGMTDVQREALEGIFAKIARILSGDPNHKDHWSDIAGGAHLVEERL